MAKIGSFLEGLWVSTPGPDDAQAFFGVFGENPLVAAIALVLIVAALVLPRAGPAPTLSERAASGPAEIHLTWLPTLSKGSELQTHHLKLAQRSSESKGQTGERLRDHLRVEAFNLYGKSRQPPDLRLLDMKSNASLERGPPQPATVDYLAASDRTHRHTRVWTYRELPRLPLQHIGAR